MPEIPWRLVKSLSSKKERDRTGLTVAEGPPSVESAILSGVAIEFLVVSESYAGSPEYAVVQAALRRAEPRGPRAGETFLAPDALFLRMAETRSPQGILCVLPRPFRYLSEAPGSPWDTPLYLLGVDIQDPGNAGALVRAAAAAGVSRASFAGESVDVFSPKCIRSSAGAVFNVALEQHGLDVDPSSILRALEVQGVQVFKAVPREGVAPWEVDLAGPSAIVVGNEARGLRPEVTAGPGTRVSIPMPGRAESLNVAVASGMILYEAMRQRRRGV